MLRVSLNCFTLVCDIRFYVYIDFDDSILMHILPFYQSLCEIKFHLSFLSNGRILVNEHLSRAVLEIMNILHFFVSEILKIK